MTDMTDDARPMVASERARVLLLLVPYLISKEEVSLAEAAAQFDVPVEEMRTMVEKLTLIGRPGDSGFWQLPHEMFDIDWELLDEQDTIRLTNIVALERAPRLSAREAAALIAGLQLASTVPGVGDSEVFAGLLSKLSRGASSTPAEVIVAPEPVDEVRIAVSDAVRRGVAVSFRYQAPDAGPTTRTVDPVTVRIADGQWYLQGWCHMRKAMRTFHLERVSEIALTEIPVGEHTDAVPELFAPSDDDVTAVLRYPTQVAPLLGEVLRGAATETARTKTIARVRIADPAGLKRLATRRGGDVEILEPASARRAAAEWATAGLANYS